MGPRAAERAYFLCLWLEKALESGQDCSLVGRDCQGARSGSREQASPALERCDHPWFDQTGKHLRAEVRQHW
jgi:hypothetical protein